MMTSGDSRVPFYAWFRALFLLYLVLPQTQGARIFYQTQLEPFLASHESDIEQLISSAHDRAKAAGLQHLKRAINFVKTNIFGVQSRQRSSLDSASLSSPQTSTGTGYTQNLLARFYLPTARAQAGVPTTTDFYNVISSVLGNPRSPPTPLSSSSPSPTAATLFGLNLSSTEERMTYLGVQRDRLRGLLQALDTEASNISPPSTDQDHPHPDHGPASTTSASKPPGGPLTKTRSEIDFENVEREDFVDHQPPGASPSSGNDDTTDGDRANNRWMNHWNWISGGGGGDGGATTGNDPSMDDQTMNQRRR